MALASRNDMKQYALRALGAPVLEINVDDDQLEDRLDEAIEYWRSYHHEGTEKIFLKHQMRASTMEITTSVADQFELGSIITGDSSGAVCKVVSQVDGVVSAGTTIIMRDVVGTFTDGEGITSNLGVTATLEASGAVTLNEFDTKYITVPDLIYGISRLIPFAGTSTSKSMFDVQYQLRLNDLYDLTSTSIIYYKQVMNHLQLLDHELNTKPSIRYNRLQNRLYLDLNWQFDIEPGQYIVAECYRGLDPTEFTKMWNEPWLKHYVVALFKKQWAVNIKKFSGLQLPGGVMLDGQALYQEAMQEIKELEEDLVLNQAPLEWFMG